MSFNIVKDRVVMVVVVMMMICRSSSQLVLFSEVISLHGKPNHPKRFVESGRLAT
jgi:hypothetical protein